MIHLPSYPQFLPLGEQVIVVQFEKEVSIHTNSQVHFYVELVNNANIPGINQIIPTFSSLAIKYDPTVIQYDELINKLENLDYFVKEGEKGKGNFIHIPVVYGGEYGPDLEEVAVRTGLSKEEVIYIHSSNSYLIYMLGFVASYPYCGDVDKRLSLPRRTSPRLRVSKGTIAIANQQSIVYPIESPGGWHNIGRTPMETFNPLGTYPTIFRAGDYIKFEPITSKEAEEWNKERQSEWNAKWNL